MKAIERELWAKCRLICSRSYEVNGNVYCYTCNAGPLLGTNRQLGHGYSKGALSAKYKYDLRILRWQCYNCNINLGGMGAIFWKNLESEIGKKYADKLLLECASSKGKPINAREHYNRLIIEYGSIQPSLEEIETI